MSYNYTPELPDDLTVPEEALIEATSNGEICKLGDGTRPSENSTDPTRFIRAEVIRFLALGGDDTNTVDPRGIQLKGAQINGILELENSIIPIEIQMKNCFFNERINLNNAFSKSIRLSGSRLRHRLNANGATVNGSFYLDKKFFITKRGELDWDVYFRFP